MRSVVGTGDGDTVGTRDGAEGELVGAGVLHSKKSGWHVRVPSQSASIAQPWPSVHCFTWRQNPPQSTSVSRSVFTVPMSRMPGSFTPLWQCAALGELDGDAEGTSVGLTLGLLLGVIVGDADGIGDGLSEGLALGIAVGLALGETLGLWLGESLGDVDGLALGETEGLALGEDVGASVLSQHHMNSPPWWGQQSPVV